MKVKITVKGLAGKASADIGNSSKEIDNRLLDGIDYHEGDFEAYLSNELIHLNNSIKSSYMKFKVENGQLYTFVYYFSDKLLTENELELLKDYTQGQLSDGIGEGFEQYPCTTLEIDGQEYEAYLSPWYHGQVLTINQEEYE